MNSALTRFKINRSLLTNKTKSNNSPPVRECLSDSSLLNEMTLYSYDYTTGKTSRGEVEETQSGDMDDENNLSFVRLLKTELSKKKIQESGSMTEEYKDSYFRLVETNQTLAKGVNLIKTKIKQYKHAMTSIAEEHDENMQLYTKQMEDLKQKIILEKSKYDEEQRSILLMRNEIRDMHRKVETSENEIQKTMEARKSAEENGTYKECEIISMHETYESSKQKLMQIYKEMDMVRDRSKRFHHTKKQFQEKISFLLSTNEKIKVYFENLLLGNETIKVENKSLEKVLKAHENICLELLRIAADKLDSHNDTKILNDITAIMKTLDLNKDNHARQKQKIQMNRQKIPSQNFKFMESAQEMNEEEEDEFHEAVAHHDGNGDGGGIMQLLEELE